MTHPANADPFKDILNLIAEMPHADEDMAGKARALIAAIEGASAPLGEAGRTARLGRLGELGIWLAGWTSKWPLVVVKPLIAVFAANDGVAAQLAQAAPGALTRRLMDQLAGGTAPVSRICAANEIGLRVLDLAVDLAGPDITIKPAFTPRECTGTFAFGMEAVAGGGDLLCLAGLGAGGQVAALAVLHALGLALPGSDQASKLAREAVAAQAAIGLPPLEVLVRVGGREIAAIAGAIIAARYQRVPVILDGMQALAAAAVLKALEPSAIAHCVVACAPLDAQGKQAVSSLGLAPLLDLDLGLEDASNAALAVGIVQAAAQLLAASAPGQTTTH